MEQNPEKGKVFSSLLAAIFFLSSTLFFPFESQAVPPQCEIGKHCCENTGSCIEPCIRKGCPRGKCCVNPACCIELGCGPSCPAPAPSLCGDGKEDLGEYCGEPGLGCLAGRVCRQCVCADLSLCGNGKTDPLEDCDDGNNLAGDGCDSTCQAEQAKSRPKQGEDFTGEESQEEPFDATLKEFLNE